MAISTSEKLVGKVDGAIGWIIFNNPERRNAVSLDMWEALPGIVDHFLNEPQVRVIVVKGEGDKAFVSGADISQFEKQRSNAELVAAFDQISMNSRAKLQQSTKPTIAMIRGYCLGGGVGLALECDLRIASENAKFGIPAARLGVGYRFEGVKRLVEVVGAAYAKEIFLTARQFTADEALGMGLVNRVVPDGELESYVADYAKRIAENAPLTMEAAKIVIDEVGKPGPHIDRDKCAAAVARCFDSADYAEGRKAFMEKRKPAFAGK